MIDILEIPFLFVAFCLLLRGLHHIRASNPGPVMVSMIATGIYILCMWIPAHLQAGGYIESKLDNAGFLLVPDSAEIAYLSLRWCVELLVIAVSEWFAWALSSSNKRHRRHSLAADPHVISMTEKITAGFLLLVGIAATLLLPAPSLEDRGVGGQGIPTLLRTFLIVGVAFIVYKKGFGKIHWWFAVFAGIAFLASTGVRSPLLVVIFAYIASELSANRFRSGPRVAIIVCLVAVFALGGSVMSNWRENVTRDYGLTTSQVVSTTLDEPWKQIYESGIDTLDGYRFSHRIAPLEESRPEDLLNIVLTFVPRAIWAEKPTDLAVDVSARYLNYGASGQYLSPIGYLTLAFGSRVGALAGISLFSFFAALLVRRYFTSFYLALVLCVALRFFLGGSSFDIYYGLTLLIPYLVALAVTRVFYTRPSMVKRKASKYEYQPAPVAARGSRF